MKKHSVIAILEAKPGQEKTLGTALDWVAQKSRLEETNLEYRLHQSIDNPQQFILYETWVSQEMHQKQFKKPYIIELGNKLESILAKPYEVYFAEEIKSPGTLK